MSKMTNKEYIKQYINMLPFLSELLGSGTEILVHDLSNPDHTLVAIQNPLTGRKVGSPTTDLVKQLLEKGVSEDLDYITNYKAKSKGKNFLSYTYFIKNEKKEIIGLLCINKDTYCAEDAISALVTLLEKHNLLYTDNNNYLENLNDTIENFLQDHISQAIIKEGISPGMMNAKEKAKIVKELNESGILKQKGAVNEVARQLGVSVPSVYRYMKLDEK